MHIVLLILKIIGIVLGVILGIALLLVLAILFVPIRYRITGKKETDGELEGYVRAHWLFPVLTFSLNYKKELKYRLRVFGIPIKKGPVVSAEEEIEEDYSGDFSDEPSESKREKKGKTKEKEKLRLEKEENSKEQREEKISQEQTDVQKEELERKSSEAQEESEPEKATEEVEKKHDALGNAEENPLNAKTTEKIRLQKTNLPVRMEGLKDKKKGKKQRQKSNSLFEKLKEIIARLKKIPCKIQNVWNNIKEIFSSVRKKKEGVFEKVFLIKDFYDNIDNKAGVGLLWENLKALLRHILPRKVKGSVTVGMEDPAATGKMLAIMGMLYGFVPSLPEIIPDFTQKTLEGKVSCRGRVRIGYVVYVLLRVWRHKNFGALKENFDKLRRTLER